jgi:ABC-type transport system substrate-binding protein
MTYSKTRIALMLSFIILSTLAMLPPSVAAQEDDYLFKVTLIAPGNANMLRRQWGQIIANSFRELGIDARVVYLGWTGCFDRALAPPLDIRGKTWDEGGFDIQLVGYTPGIVPNPAQIFYGMESSWAPYGANYYLYNNTVMNTLCETYLTTTNATEREEAALAIQPILYADLPHSKIMAQNTPAVINPELGGPALADSPGGPGWLYFNVEPRAELIDLPVGKSQVVYAQTGEIEALIPPLSYSWYDITIYTHIFSGLVTTSQDFSNTTIPELLTNWEVSEDGFKWTWTTRSGVTWHDGEPFTADDVVFSLWANLNTTTGSQHAGDYAIAMGDNIKFTTVEPCELWENTTTTTVGTGTKVGNVTALDANTVEMWLPELLAGKPYGFWDPYLLGFDHNIIPMHVMEHVPLGEWEDSVFNTGEGSYEIDGTTYNGPVGTGPYKWVDYDPVAQIIHLEKNNQYWNTTAIEAAGLFEVEDYYIRFIVDKTSALAALKNGEVDILDPQYQMQADVDTIGEWGKVLLNTGCGDQEIGYNNLHPIFGTGVDTPLGQSNASRAAEAANYVRMAFDYAIPRQLIIDNLLDGFGSALGVHWQPWQLYANTSITARPYDLAKAAEYLAMAGYDIPVPEPPVVTNIVGMSVPISGVHTNPSTGGIAPDKDLELRMTTDNATFTTVGVTVTDFAGRYFFTVTPTEPGTYYLWTFDRLYSAVDEVYQGTYLQKVVVQSFANALSESDVATDVSNISSQLGTLTNIAYAGVGLSVVAIALAFIFGRKQ